MLYVRMKKSSLNVFLLGGSGVEQLSSLQHLDLAYNLLLEHSQLAPLSLLHCLCTVRRHSPEMGFSSSLCLLA